MKAVDLLSRLGRGLFRLPQAKDDVSVETAELGEIGVQELLLLGETGLHLPRRSIGHVSRSGRVEPEQTLLVRERGDVEDGLQKGVGDDVGDGHGRLHHEDAKKGGGGFRKGGRVRKPHHELSITCQARLDLVRIDLLSLVPLLLQQWNPFIITIITIITIIIFHTIINIIGTISDMMVSQA